MGTKTPLEKNRDYQNIPTDVPLGEITEAIERCAKAVAGESIEIRFLVLAPGTVMYEAHATSLKRRKRQINIRGVLKLVVVKFCEDLISAYEYATGRLFWRVGGDGVEFSPVDETNPNATFFSSPIEYLAGQIAEKLGPEYLGRMPTKH